MKHRSSFIEKSSKSGKLLIDCTVLYLHAQHLSLQDFIYDKDLVLEIPIMGIMLAFDQALQEQPQLKSNAPNVSPWSVLRADHSQ